MPAARLPAPRPPARRRPSRRPAQAVAGSVRLELAGAQQAERATPRHAEPAQRRPPTWLRCARWRCAEGNRKQTRKDKGWPQSASLKEACHPTAASESSDIRVSKYSFLFMNVHHRGPHNPPIAQIKVKRDNAESHTVLNTMDTVRAASAQCPVPHT